LKTDRFFGSFLRLGFLQHLLFWIASITALTYVFKVSAQPEEIDVIFALIFHVPIWIAVYFNLYVLIPKILGKDRYTGYITSLILLIVGMSFFYQFLFNHLIDLVLKGYFFISYYEYWDYVLFLSGYLIITTLIKLAKGWFRLSEIENEKKSMELEIIKSQVNPHFLFNTLNTLYGEALNNEKSLPDSILNLSSMLRYSLYEANKNNVNAASEIDFIRSYIALQKKRFNTKGQHIELKIQGKFTDVNIPSMVLLPFTENCFKHASENEAGHFFIRIEIIKHMHSIEFVTENSYRNQGVTSGGLGVKNTLRRLDLLYSENNYNFEKKDNTSVYRVRLTLRTK
jgi:two-component system, LytTR family, sensor kinase